MRFYFWPFDVDVADQVDSGSALINPVLSGAAILTVSSVLTKLGDDAHGVISIGPFAFVLSAQRLKSELDCEKGNQLVRC
jgi:predicted nucleotide-binding protein (sugar kinase/HSP70/actin superfamily)